MATIGGGLNTTTPYFDPAASGGLQVEYTRNPASFKLNRYIRIVPLADQLNGKYLRIDPIQGTRVTASPQSQLWPFGQDRPKGMPLEFSFQSFSCERYTESFNLPMEPTRAARWDVRATSARVAAQRLMTGRAQRLATLLQTTGNYTSGQTYAATTNLLGSTKTWDSSTATDKGIQKSIRKIAQNAAKATGSSVQLKDIVMVMGPGTADRMAASPEIEKYVVNNMRSLDFLTYRGDFDSYGLPPNLFGLGDVVVDDTVITATKQNATTTTTSFMWADGYVGFYARPGAMVSQAADTQMADYAAVSLFAYEDMSVEVFDGTEDAQKHRRIDGGVTDTSDIKLTAPAGAFLLVDCFS